MVKISNIIDETVILKKRKWKNNPKLGWITENNTVNIFYGTTNRTIKSILRDGIYPLDTSHLNDIHFSDGYVICSLEPYTAVSTSRIKSQLSESSRPFSIKEMPVVFHIGYPSALFKNVKILVDPMKRMDKKIYESWGKSDVEYYALVHVGVSNHIPIKYIKGYMVK